MLNILDIYIVIGIETMNDMYIVQVCWAIKTVLYVPVWLNN